VLKPHGGQRLLLILRDFNLARPDRYDTVQLVSWLQQAIAHGGFYDGNLDFVTFKNIQIVGTAAPENAPGRVPLSPRFTGSVRVLALSAPDDSTTYSILIPAISRALSAHPSPLADTSRIVRSVATFLQEYKAKFPDKKALHHSVSTSDAVAICESLALYDWSDSSTCLPAVLANELDMRLRWRLASCDDLSSYDELLATTLLPALKSGPAQLDGFVLSTLGCTAQDRLARATIAGLWKMDDFRSLVSSLACTWNIMTGCGAHAVRSLFFRNAHQVTKAVNCTFSNGLSLLTVGTWRFAKCTCFSMTLWQSHRQIPLVSSIVV
jgi:dynein heavy chain 2, cytosolic